MILWKNTPTVKEMNAVCANTIHEALGIRFTRLGDDFLQATMPVDGRTHQPAGFLHGGASVVLAESLGSIASMMVAGGEASQGFGIEVNASHIKAVKTGIVTGTARAIHLGARIHRWEIKLTDESGDLVSLCRLTVYIQRPKV